MVVFASAIQSNIMRDQVSVNIAALVAASTSPTRSIDPAKIKARSLEHWAKAGSKDQVFNFGQLAGKDFGEAGSCGGEEGKEKGASLLPLLHPDDDYSSCFNQTLHFGQLFRQEYQRFKRLCRRPRLCRRWRSRCITSPSSPANLITCITSIIFPSSPANRCENLTSWWGQWIIFDD